MKKVYGLFCFFHLISFSTSAQSSEFNQHCDSILERKIESKRPKAVVYNMFTNKCPINY